MLPVASGYPQSLAAAYRVTLGPLVVAIGELRLTLLFRRCATLRLDGAALLADPMLAAADPALDSVVNVNTPRGIPGRPPTTRAEGEHAVDRSDAD